MDTIENKPPQKILIIDQESFSTLIAKMLSSVYATTTVPNGIEAIQCLRKNRPDLLIVEQRIKGDGLRFCELLAMNPLFSDIPIILLSVTPSTDSMIRAQAAGVNTYLAKPFRPSELLKRIDAVLSVSKNNPTPQIQAPAEDHTILKNNRTQIEGLPPFPITLSQFLEQINLKSALPDNIAKHLDPSLLATFFKIVNSPAYKLQKKVDSLELAISLLGVEEIANVVITAHVFNMLGTYNGGSGLDRKGFWQHSIGTAFIMRAISKKLQTEIESAFLAGLFHDLGKIVLDRFYTGYYHNVVTQSKTENMWIGDAENHILGLTHAHVGAQVATQWQLPEKYRFSILYHHAPETTERYQHLTSLVHLADHMCRKLGYGSGGDPHVPELHPTVLDRFLLGKSELDILFEVAKREQDAANSFWAALASD